MKIIATVDSRINRPIKDVFEYVSNMENFQQWFQGVNSITSLDETPHGVVGKTYLEAVDVPIKGRQNIKLKVVECIQPTNFVTEGKFPPVLPIMEIELSEKNEYTHIRWSMYTRNNGLMFRLLLLPLVQRLMMKRAAESIQVLKNKLESAGA